MFKEINQGGSHESNPLGGVPMGLNNQGVPVTYEEGETSIPTDTGEYVFSDRLKVTKDMAKRLSLPKSLIGKSFADASKHFNNKFKDRTDKISESTKNKLLDGLVEAQEFVKQEEAAKIANAMGTNSTEVPDMMGGQVPPEMAQFAQQPMMWGGDSGGQGSGGGFMAGIGGMLGGFGQGMNSNNDDPGRPQDETSTAWEGTKDVVSNFGPFFKLFRGVEQMGKGAGQAIGGDEGGDFTTGFLDPMHNKFRKDYSFGEKLAGIDPLAAGMLAMRKNKELRNKAKREETAQLSQLTGDSYAKGGHVKHMPDGGYRNAPSPYDPFLGNHLKPFQRGMNFNPNNWNPSNNFGDGLMQGTMDDLVINVNRNKPEVAPLARTTTTTSNTPAEDSTTDGKKKSSKDPLRALRYAPILMNAYQLSQLKKPTAQAPMVDDAKARRDYVDTNAALERINSESNSAINTLTQTGMSGGALRNSITSTMLNRSRALGDTALKADAMNKQIDSQADQIDRQTNLRNMAEQARVREIYDRDLGMYNSNKSGLLGQLGNDIGGLGSEALNRDLVREMYGYGWDGQYVTDKDGNKSSPSEFIAKHGRAAWDWIQSMYKGRRGNELTDETKGQVATAFNSFAGNPLGRSFNNR